MLGADVETVVPRNEADAEFGNWDFQIADYYKIEVLRTGCILFISEAPVALCARLLSRGDGLSVFFALFASSGHTDDQLDCFRFSLKK